MLKTLKKYVSDQIGFSAIKEKGVVEAYDIWSAGYDAQPGNLMLDLDDLLFSKLLSEVVLKGKHVADIGCGTGRHWKKIYANEPTTLTGFDVSGGMLKRLHEKFPLSQTHLITDNLFLPIADKRYDVIVSTLTVAHIKNIEEAVTSWCRLLKDEGHVFITDFHPDALAFGGQRTFKHQNTRIAVQNYVHSINLISSIFKMNGFEVVSNEEKKVNESVKHYYADQNAMHVYNKFEGFSIIYGIHFQRM